MAATYRAVMLTKKGGPEVLQIVELPIEPPGPGQLRVRVRAAGVGATDLIMLAGKYRYAPEIPFVPGYEVAGMIEAIGAGVTGFEVGQRVAALIVYSDTARFRLFDVASAKELATMHWVSPKVSLSGRYIAGVPQNAASGISVWRITQPWW